MHFCNILLVTQVGPAYSVGMGSIKGEKPKKGGDHMRPLWRRGTSAVCRWHQNYYIFLIWTVIDEGRAGALELLRLVFESQFQHLLHYLSLVTQFFQTSVFPSVNGASRPDFPGLLWKDNQIMQLTHQVRAGTWEPSASTKSSLLCHPATTFLVPILYRSPLDIPLSETEVFAGAETEEPTWALWRNLGPVVSNAALKTKFCQ